MIQELPPILDPDDGRVSIAPMSHPDLRRYPPAILEFYELNRIASREYEEQLPVRKDSLERDCYQKALNVCVDGRVIDAAWALGLPMGMLEPYRSAGAVSDLERDYYRTRRSANLLRKLAVHVYPDSPPKKMGEMAMFSVHHSFSQPHTASCAAWKHDTDAALKNAQRLSDQYNKVFKGYQVVGFPVLIDTDLDAFTFIGPEGRLDVRSLYDRADMQNGSSYERVLSELKRIFPPDWLPLARLEAPFAVAFHNELAERVIANVGFVRNVVATKRPIELLDHQERMVFVGRHADWIPVERHNSIFLVDDTEEQADVIDSFLIGMKYTVRNLLLDAISKGDRDWCIPVIINVPHEEEFNDEEAGFKARIIRDYLTKALRDRRFEIFEWIVSGDHGLPKRNIPDWLFRQLHEELFERTFFAPSISFRKTRLFRAFA